MPAESTWDAKRIRGVLGTVPEPNPGAQDMRIRAPRSRAEHGVAGAALPGGRQLAEQAPKRFRINATDFDEIGFTARCGGCRALQLGLKPQAHSEECRAKVTAQLQTSEEGRKRMRVARPEPEAADPSGEGPEPAQPAEPSVHDPPGGALPMEFEGPPREDEDMQHQEDRKRDGDVVRLPAAPPGQDDTDGGKRRRMMFKQPDPASSMMDALPETVPLPAPTTPTEAAASNDMDISGALDTGEFNIDVMMLWGSPGAEKGENDVSEIYSPPRVTRFAHRHGLRPGWSLDLKTLKEQGEPWDFDIPSHRAQAIQLL